MTACQLNGCGLFPNTVTKHWHNWHKTNANVSYFAGLLFIKNNNNKNKKQNFDTCPGCVASISRHFQFGAEWNLASALKESHQETGTGPWCNTKSWGVYLSSPVHQWKYVMGKTGEWRLCCWCRRFRPAGCDVFGGEASASVRQWLCVCVSGVCWLGGRAVFCRSSIL